MSIAYEKLARAGGLAGLAHAGAFFMNDNPVAQSMRNITKRLADLGIDYALVGGMALVLHGADRTTVDVDLLVTPEGLRASHDALEGLGYVPPFEGSKNLRDTNTGVRIEFLVTGNYPGDGKPKPVAFPNPADVVTNIDGIKVINLSKLIELKLASGLTGGTLRMKDFTDVISLIILLKLDQSFGQSLDDYVRPKFDELWNGVKDSPMQGEY